MERPFFGCLQPCNTALRRIDFVKTQPLIAIGRGANNDFVLPGMRISYNHCRIMWDGSQDAQSRVIVHDNSTNGTWINGARVLKGQSRILRDGNEIAFGSPMQQQNQLEDYRYIYRHLALYELTGIHAHYDMAHELGRGTFATVMKAMSRTTSDWWAVKIIHSQKIRGANANNNDNNNAAARQNSGHLQNLGREISILEKLNHPNICRLREMFVPEDGGHDFYLVLELIEGGDLLDFILSRNGLSEPMAQHITSQICSALSYIHEKGITHRDLKPENVLLTKDDPPIVKIADFGLAKVVDSLTMLRTMCGTPNYLAPEVVTEGVRIKGYDHLVDSWSVGVIVFSMLTNTGPFIEDDEEPDIQRRITGRQISWNTLEELGVSTTAQEFIRRLLDVNPTTRMSLTDALRHPWLSPSAPGGGGAGQEPAVMQHGLDRNLSDVSELSALPEDDEHAGVNGDASMLSAAPSTDVMLGVHSLQINTPQRARPPLERRSKVLARELESEAETQATATSQAAASSSPSGGAKRPRSETDNAGSSPVVDVAMMTGGGVVIRTGVRRRWTLWIRSHALLSVGGAIRIGRARRLRQQSGGTGTIMVMPRDACCARVPRPLLSLLVDVVDCG
ncbi:kinase-like domain-containing protein [Russula aff. rugulosa BPL654]|nr:kinase-like domain-containing protein [Russula aff. rugulosa BPL654]